MSQINQNIIRDPKAFQVRFIIEAHCIPSPFQRRITGWQPVYGAEWTTIAEARKSLSTRIQRCTRWDGLRLVKRVHHDGQVVEQEVT